MGDEKITNRTPWNRPWSDDGLEHLGKCPVCSSSYREIVHKDLIDNTFFCASGKWLMWRCRVCSSGYLDPRPNVETIHQAYQSYYTHQDAAKMVDYDQLSPFHRLRRKLTNGYINWRYGAQRKPSSRFGVLVYMFFPSIKCGLDREYRNLPILPINGGILLDVGCGNGSFLGHARSVGWTVVGLDPDIKVVANAVKRGFTVHEGGIDYFEGKSELFDVITLNHVIEHVHDPVMVLKSCYELLKPGGKIWLETPNFDSFVHERFKKNWRGLEAPRHLTLFTHHSLRQALVDAGFLSSNYCVRPSAVSGMYKSSYEIEHGGASCFALRPPMRMRIQINKTKLLEYFFPKRKEYITMIGIKQNPHKLN